MIYQSAIILHKLLFQTKVKWTAQSVRCYFDWKSSEQKGVGGVCNYPEGEGGEWLGLGITTLSHHKLCCEHKDQNTVATTELITCWSMYKVNSLNWLHICKPESRKMTSDIEMVVWCHMLYGLCALSPAQRKLNLIRSMQHPSHISRQAISHDVFYISPHSRAELTSNHCCASDYVDYILTYCHILEYFPVIVGSMLPSL